LKTSAKNFPLTPALILLLSSCFFSSIAFASSLTSPKRSNSDRDIASIGHRKISGEKLGNFYSVAKENVMGAELSTKFEQENLLLSDPAATAYIQQLTQRIAHNSDAEIPIIVRVVDSEKSFAVVLPGGYQYISRGLMLQLRSEGELASILARGIAHTALRSITKELTRSQYANIANIPLALGPHSFMTISTIDDFSAGVVFLSLRRRHELDADYLAVQYLFKAGYDPECYIRAIESVWSSTSHARASSLSPFPLLADRVRFLQQEINDILPRQAGAVVSKQEFEEFQNHLHGLPPVPKSEPGTPDAKPFLRRAISPYSSIFKFPRYFPV
jgi:beta-barrel assembly-enhancing protease